MLVEVATAERDASEQRWLGEIAAQVNVVDNHVAVLIYFDGLPGESQYQASFTPDAKALLSMWELVKSAQHSPLN